ncbi:MAG: hypothetical protein HYV00_07095, partial [Deltaproteobacteria bacterium]|nr:hypothetical protein [Deltaproteobacteria bacterium]
MSKRLLEHRPLGFKPRLILAGAEILNASARSLIQRAFQAKVRQTYACAEFSRMAFECEFENLHAIPGSTILETEGAGEVGDGANLLVTSLYQKTMPLIRYRLGDRVALSEERCQCGSNFQVIKAVIGRMDDYLTLPSGRQISPRAINPLEDISGVTEYQIIQKKRDYFEVLVRPGPDFTANSEESIKKVIAAGCLGEPVRIHVIKSAGLRRLPSGKLRAVIS